MTMKAVGTAAMEMVQEVEIQFDEVRSGEGMRELCVTYRILTLVCWLC